VALERQVQRHDRADHDQARRRQQRHVRRVLADQEGQPGRRRPQVAGTSVSGTTPAATNRLDRTSVLTPH